MAKRILKLPRRFMQLLDKMVDTRVTPLAYLVLFHNLIFSIGFILFSEGGVDETVLAQIGIPFGVVFWACSLFASVVIIWSGFWWRIHRVVMAGSMLGFAAWLAAAIAYFWGDAHFQGTLALATCLQYAYFFVGAGLDRLWDYTPVDTRR